MSNEQTKYNNLVAQLNSVNLEFNTCRSLVRERRDDNIALQALLDTYKNECNLPEGQIADFRRKKTLFLSSETHVMQKRPPGVIGLLPGCL